MSAIGATPPGPLPPVRECLLWSWGGQTAQAVGSKRSAVSTRRGLVLGLRDADGRLGLGEASPLPSLSPDGLEDCEGALRTLPELLPGAPTDAEGFPLLPTWAALPAARFALETALADLWAQRLSDAAGPPQTLAQVLGGRRLPPPLPLNALVGSLSEAEAAVRAGFATLKLKIGGPDFRAELRLLQQIREALPRDIALRLDANGAYSPAEAEAHLRALAPLSPEYVEQPVAPGGQDLARVPDLGIPLAADESLLFPDERAALLRGRRAAVWVIKPALHGLRMARALAVQAQGCGIDVVVTHLFDGPLGLRAAAALAFSLPQPPRACGLAPHPGLAAWPVGAEPWAAVTRPGGGPASLLCDGGPGLGCIDREALARGLGRPQVQATVSGRSR